MDLATRRRVRARASERCEYCKLHQRHSEVTHHIEHIVAKQHDGSENTHNLAFACHLCNLKKGTNLSGIDPLTGLVVSLFHPRKDKWDDHFIFRGAEIRALGASARATIRVLAMNDPDRIELRRQISESDE
jgi:hypothetical protein